MNRIEMIEFFDRYPQPNIATDDFDDLLWDAVVDWVPDNQALKTLPLPVRVYYVTRYVEWEVANGGFDQLVFNIWNTSDRSADAVAEFLKYAIEGYAMLGRQQAEVSMQQVLAITESEFARMRAAPGWIPDDDDAFDEYFNEEAFNAVQAGAIDKNNGEDFWSDATRLAYVVSQKESFIEMTVS